MSRRRRLAIAAQAVAVAVLVAIVYLTLLHPDDGGDLSGIQAPGGGRAHLPTPGGHGERSDRRPGTTGPGGGFQGRVHGPYRYWWGGQEGPGGPDELVGTPSDHQYGDAVGELLKRVGD